MLYSYHDTSSVQVNTLHYDFVKYVSFERWNSYWHQIKEVLDANPNNVLIIGVGDNIVPSIISTTGVKVKTLDFDTELKADYVGDIRNIESIVSNKSFDVVMCCQVLEHIDFRYFESVVQSLINVSRKKLILSIPYSYRILFHLSIKLPKIPRITREISIPTFWKKWKFNGEHFWEVGVKGYQKKKIDQIVYKIAPSTESYFATANKGHLFYVIDCSGEQ